MFGEGHHDSLVQHGLDEAFACQDMLERVADNAFPVDPGDLAHRLGNPFDRSPGPGAETTRDSNGPAEHLKRWQG